MDQLSSIQHASTWNKFSASYEAYAEPFTSRFGSALARKLAVVPGERVLDIAAGTGALALELARQGADGLAIDHSDAMTERIRERAASGGTRVRAETMDGQQLALPDASFDAGISVFGMMMFPDHEAGLRELARILRPGGRAGVAVWRRAEGAGPALLLHDARVAVLSDQPGPLLPQGARDWCDPDRLTASFQRAGLVDIIVEELTLDWTFLSLDHFREHGAHMLGLMPAWADARADERERLLAHMVAALGRSERLAIPSTALLATARKPS